MGWLPHSSMLVSTKRNNVWIEDEFHNIACAAFSTDAVNRGNQFTQRQCLFLLVFGFHAGTLSLKACQYYGVFAL